MRKYPLIFFFYCIFRQLFFFSRPLRGRFLTFFSISRKKKMKKWKSLKNLKKKKKKCGKFGFLKAMRAGSWDRLFFFFGLILFLTRIALTSVLCVTLVPHALPCDLLQLYPSTSAVAKWFDRAWLHFVNELELPTLQTFGTSERRVKGRVALYWQ